MTPADRVAAALLPGLTSASLWRPFAVGRLEQHVVGCIHQQTMRPEPLACIAAAISEKLRGCQGSGSGQKGSWAYPGKTHAGFHKNAQSWKLDIVSLPDKASNTRGAAELAGAASAASPASLQQKLG
jgi:hypothetical protein